MRPVKRSSRGRTLGGNFTDGSIREPSTIVEKRRPFGEGDRLFRVAGSCHRPPECRGVVTPLSWNDRPIGSATHGTAGEDSTHRFTDVVREVSV